MEKGISTKRHIFVGARKKGAQEKRDLGKRGPRKKGPSKKGAYSFWKRGKKGPTFFIFDKTTLVISTNFYLVLYNKSTLIKIQEPPIKQSKQFYASTLDCILKLKTLFLPINQSRQFYASTLDCILKLKTLLSSPHQTI